LDQPPEIDPTTSYAIAVTVRTSEGIHEEDLLRSNQGWRNIDTLTDEKNMTDATFLRRAKSISESKE